MNSERDNIEQWISRRPDADLTAEQQAAIDHAMQNDSSLAADAGRYERLNGLLRGWRLLPDAVDWNALAARTQARVGKASKDHADDAFDERLRDAVPEMPPVDWGRLKLRISAAVAVEAARRTQRTWGRRWQRLVTTIVPLAAAAVIALAVWRAGDVDHVAAPGKSGGLSMIVVSLDVPNPSGEITIAFDERPSPGSTTGESLGGAAIAIGSNAGEASDLSAAALFF